MFKIRRAAAIVGASAALMLGTLVVSPAADAATAPVSASRTTGPPGCGITYTHSTGLTTQTIRATNNCSWGQLCIRVRTWTGWWNVQTSPELWINPGATGGWKWTKGRNHYSVFYC